MILETRLAKSIMENEEGLNHLWILLSDDLFDYKELQLNVQLPEGVHRLPNLNGHAENESIMPDLSKGQDVLLEIYTEDAIECGERIITVSLVYSDGRKQNEMSHNIPVTFVNDEEIEAVSIDEEVVDRLKELRNTSPRETLETTDCVNIRPNTVVKSNKFSFLEEKYRVDY